jgi:uncharacterized protein (DUF58 family)
VRAFPREQRLRELIAPLRTQPFLGTHVARAGGEGIEFADIRPFVVGDRVRDVNWRATAKRGVLYVTERHPEHASDVVLLLARSYRQPPSSPPSNTRRAPEE